MTKNNDVLRPALWTPRPVSEVLETYVDWAATYDADVKARGYRTPDRVAAALRKFVDPATVILDYGCGTGLGGAALHRAGFTTLHGTDVTKDMLDQAQATGFYEKTWTSGVAELGFDHGAYGAIAAIGVVSLGAAPADLLAVLIGKLAAGQVLALSYNDPTLHDDSYLAALEAELTGNRAELLFREHGAHLDDVGMGSDVIVLRRL